MSGMRDYLRLRNGVTHVYELGVRPVGELVSLIGERFGITDEILDILDEWRSLDAETIRALEGHRFPSLLRVVPK